MRAVRVLARLDARDVVRDPLLSWLIVYPIAIALLLRFAVPALEAPLIARFGFALSDYRVLIASFLIELMPVLCGMVVGFLLLDARDDATLTAVQVTPLGLGGYFAYRIAAPIVVSVGMTLISVPLAGLVPIGFGPLLALSVGAAPLAPTFALFLAAFARNKVEGFALAKAAGVLFLPPLFAWFVAPPWQWAFGVLPTFWPVKAFWMLFGAGAGAATGTGAGAIVAVLAIGLVVQGLFGVWLARRFRRRLAS